MLMIYALQRIRQSLAGRHPRVLCLMFVTVPNSVIISCFSNKPNHGYMPENISWYLHIQNAYRLPYFQTLRTFYCKITSSACATNHIMTHLNERLLVSCVYTLLFQPRDCRHTLFIWCSIAQLPLSYESSVCLRYTLIYINAKYYDADVRQETIICRFSVKLWMNNSSAYSQDVGKGCIRNISVFFRENLLGKPDFSSLLQ